MHNAARSRAILQMDPNVVTLPESMSISVGNYVRPSLPTHEV